MEDIEEQTYLIEIEMADGTSQIVQISREEALSLGLEFEAQALETVESVETYQPIFAVQSLPTQIVAVPAVNYILAADNSLVTQPANTPTTSATATRTPNVINTNLPSFHYKVITPEDLNLKPRVTTTQKSTSAVGLPMRGRPKAKKNNRMNTEASKQNSKVVASSTEPPPLVALSQPAVQARTRSGRVTKPPKDLQDNFKKIITNDNPHVEDKDVNVIRIAEFTSLKTNNKEVVEPILDSTKATEAPVRKRTISTQHRCFTCGKAYIGLQRIGRHYKNFPDHRPKSHLALSTLTAGENSENSRTWCCLIDTAKYSPEGRRGQKFCAELRTLVRNLKILAKYMFRSVKDANSGGYLLDNELSTVLGLPTGWYTMHESKLSKDMSIYAFLENIDDHVLSALSINEDNAAQTTDEPLTQKPKSRFSADIADESRFSTKDSDKAASIYQSSASRTDAAHAPPIDIFEPESSKSDEMSNASDLKPYRQTLDDMLNIGLSETKSSDDTNPLIESNMSDVDNIDSLDLPLNKKAKTDVVAFDLSKPAESASDISAIPADLMNISDDLLCCASDGTQVHMLDTSTNSDDIMNVDHFVNERFKKITGGDSSDTMESSLDLPPLDIIFPFDTSR